jgi:hypothetical protein
MSSAPVPPNPPAQPRPSDAGLKSTDRIVIYHHSNFFYWWPVWLLGFLFAAITYFQDWHFAYVPPGTVAAHARKVEVDDKGTTEVRDVLILGKDKKLPDEETGKKPVQPYIFVSPTRSFGTVFVIILLIVATITSITIRGLWTVFVLVLFTMLTFIFWAADFWETIFRELGQFSIHINLGGYLLIAFVLLILWLVNFVFLDRQVYMIFTPGQVRVRTEIGGEETVYDTTGMAVMKQRADLFRHWILGFGSGDLIIKPVGVPNPIEFPNVLFVGAKVTKIERMIKEKVIVSSQEKGA